VSAHKIKDLNLFSDNTIPLFLTSYRKMLTNKIKIAYVEKLKSISIPDKHSKHHPTYNLFAGRR
jgi:hypothetical protein